MTRSKFYSDIRSASIWEVTKHYCANRHCSTVTVITMLINPLTGLKCLPTSPLSVCCVSDYVFYNRMGNLGLGYWRHCPVQKTDNC